MKRDPAHALELKAILHKNSASSKRCIVQQYVHLHAGRTRKIILPMLSGGVEPACGHGEKSLQLLANYT